MSIQRALLATFVIGFVGFLAESAQGADAKTYPGALCAPWAAEDGSGFNRTESLTNIDVFTHIVNCPIVRDNTTTTTGFADLEIYVSPNNGNFNCEAIGRTRFNAAIIRIAKTASGTGNKTIDYGTTVNLGQNKGYYLLRCEMPPGSTLYGYFVNEN